MTFSRRKLSGLEGLEGLEVRGLDTTTLPANSRAHTGAKEANVCAALHHLENEIKSNN